MAEHDYVINNQSAPAFRADLNNALQAIVSNNSKGTEPTVTYANMTWYDTATNWIFVRNETNSDWVRFAYLDQATNQISLVDNTTVVNTSGTQTGLLGDQSTATWQAGTGTTQSLVSPANVKSAIDALAEGGATELISTVNCAGATEVVYTGLSASLYSKYVFVLSYILPTLDSRSLKASLSSNNGSTWDSNYHEPDSTSTPSGIYLTDGSTTSMTYMDNTGDFAGYSGQVELYLSSSNSRRTYVKHRGVWFDASTTSTFRHLTSGNSTKTTNNYNAIKFFPYSAFSGGGGTIQSGTISMYGVKK